MIAHFGRSRVPTKEAKTEEEESPSHSENTSLMEGRRHPFVDSVLGVNWKGLNKDRYDGPIDPDEHIIIYITQMSLYTMGEAIFCRLFLTIGNHSKLVHLIIVALH